MEHPPFNMIMENAKLVKTKSSSMLLLVFYGNYENNRNYGNVAIKRGQRLLADYAEHEQRKDCEAGLIIGI